jgi:2-succinyl-6-hydroxy-2,4-cyclohexadiene-1-carboxylate synthase
MNTNFEIWALPGFLGAPQDWDFLSWKNLRPMDWQLFAWNSLPEWGRKFNTFCNEKDGFKILMGYSLGGRLALHALLDQPHRWQAAILISTHVGLADPQERNRRYELDKRWAKRFESQEWKSLIKDWNAQKVFAQDPFCFVRQENHYRRQDLVNALIHGSLGKQEDLRQAIAELPIPILWLTGEKDFRYCQIAETLTFAHPLSRWNQIANAGHRAPWSQPDIFANVVQSFLREVMVSVPHSNKRKKPCMF